MRIEEALATARLALAFGEVERATRHPDGRPESDATHTIMLIMIAAELARDEGLDVAAVVQLAAVHDLAEAYAGDTNTARALDGKAREAKAEREAAAVERIAVELGDSWAVRWLREYERQRTPEARLVRFADKILPKLTHALNGGIALEEIGMSPEESSAANTAQGRAFSDANPDLDEVARLFDAAHRAAIFAYLGRIKGEHMWDCEECATGWRLCEAEAAEGCPLDHPERCGGRLVRRDRTRPASEGGA